MDRGVRSDGRGAQQARILLVDDHAQVRDGLRWILSAAEDLIVQAEARDGIEALERLGSQPFDVVVTDLSMPRLDGLELIRRIRAQYPHMGVIALSMQGDEQIAILCLREGADAFVPKDSSSDEIVRWVREAALERG